MAAATALAIGVWFKAPDFAGSAAVAAPTVKLPQVPANGEMGFVVSRFGPAVVEGDKTACPQGPGFTLRESYLDSLPSAERARLSLPANEPELTKRWQALAFGPNGTNICSQPDMFDRPVIKRTVQSRRAVGMNLDGDSGDGSGNAESCTHENFTSPSGERGIDNQAYRVLGCSYLGPDGTAGEVTRGYSQFLASGEWTQLILVRGVDSLEHDEDVEVIYANTPDRPPVDSKGNFIPGASFTVSNTLPRYRNVLRGRIDHGVITTEPNDIKLTQTWGQGGARDIRGNRTKFDLRRARLRLSIQADGSLKGVVGGYQPAWELIQSPSLGGVGAALVAGVDCAARLKTLKMYADGIRDPKTGQCTGVSNAYDLAAVPAMVNDVPEARR
ncbi:hypothetical protein ACFSCW_15440 [Sphingomonas tabacisoli]|uniref:Secreted protein n=1 Tax=Sphingomonas tabacisoli TaxID=2249466 RepID=A0ABW4I5N3_9SPHN